MDRSRSASYASKGADRTRRDELTTDSRAVWFAISVTFVLLCLRPISADDVWWQLSRGRAVLAGTVSPSRSLLANDDASEADWLGGVPWYAAYRECGTSGLLLLRALVIAAVLFCLMFNRTSAPRWLELPVFTAAVLAAGDAWEPTPALLDVLCLVLLARVVSAWEVQRNRQSPYGVIGVLLLWANLGPRVALGAIWVALSCLGRNYEAPVHNERSRWLVKSGCLAAALLACSATPRGWWTLWDSMRVVFPRLAADAASLAGTPWQPLIAADWNASQWAFLCLSLFALVVLASRKPTLATSIQFFISQAVAWSSAANLPVATVWLLLLVLNLIRDARHAARCSASDDYLRMAFKKHPVIVVPLALIAPAILWLLSPQLGWGFDRRLDHRLIGQVLAASKPSGTAFCDGTRSTGMLCWLAPPQLLAQDIPQRALLGGRLRKEKLLLDDLQREFLWSYYREDRSEGGWWIPFEQRKTSLVLVSADSPELIRALEPTLWKPLLLDSAVIAFAKAGDPRYNQQILDVLQLRSFLDRGTWVFNPEPRSGSEFDRDWWGLRPEPWSVAEIKRQAQVFRSMQLVIAALKTLNPALKGSTGSDLHQEFAQCQQELLNQERLVAGQASEFRKAAATAGDEQGRNASSIVGARDAVAESPIESQIERAVGRYLRGDLPAAIRDLDSDRPEDLYAVACLSLESGQPDACATVLRRLKPESRPTPIQLLALHLLKTVAPGNDSR